MLFFARSTLCIATCKTLHLKDGFFPKPKIGLNNTYMITHLYRQCLLANFFHYHSLSNISQFTLQKPLGTFHFFAYLRIHCSIVNYIIVPAISFR